MFEVCGGCRPLDVRHSGSRPCHVAGPLGPRVT